MKTYKGSSKNVLTNDQFSLFEFTDRYSIYDWGEMPDLIPQKGLALSVLAQDLFFCLEQNGVRHHFISACDSQGAELDHRRTNFMKVKKIEVIRPQVMEGRYDYAAYQTRPSNILIPLEVIFRWGAPEGSSYLKRAPAVKPGTLFEDVRIEMTTKLERLDRFLSPPEAQMISGLNDFEFEELHHMTKKIAKVLKDLFSKAGFELWDGKLEFAFDSQRRLMLVDAIGLDELRLIQQGFHFSKEILRRHYRESSWLSQFQHKKNQAGSWEKSDFEIQPEPLPAPVLKLVSVMYQFVANEVSRAVGRDPIFECKFALEDLVKGDIK